MPPEKLGPLLNWAAARLKAAGCETPALDARLLLQHAAGVKREDIILDPGRAVPEQVCEIFCKFISRREAREPVSRILGEREFYGRGFRVTPAVLDPRPDTEILVDAALQLMPQGARILDLGVGSGAIIVTLLAERVDTSGLAVDLSSAALAMARLNAELVGVADRLAFEQGSWFTPVIGQFDLIISNPPYIPARDIGGLAPDVRNFDPALALVGGDDGLDPYRMIAAGAGAHLAAGCHVLVEIGAGQSGDVKSIFAGAGFQPAGRHFDLGGQVRCLEFVLTQ